LVSIVIGHFVYGHETAVGTVLSVAGGSALVFFHFLNRRTTCSTGN
jgi:hypothetical protein